MWNTCIHLLSLWAWSIPLHLCCLLLHWAGRPPLSERSKWAIPSACTEGSIAVNDKQTNTLNKPNSLLNTLTHSVSILDIFRKKNTLFEKRRSSFFGKLSRVLPNAELFRVSIHSTHTAWGEISGQTHTKTLAYEISLSLTQALPQSFYTLLTQHRVRQQAEQTEN